MADREQFREFVPARSTALARTAYLLTGDTHRAEDLLQTALAKAAGAWHRIDGGPEPYVRRILHHQSISWWRARSRRVTETPRTVRATRFAWSPRSRWLAWTGLRITEWDREQGMSTLAGAAGRIGPGATSSEPLETGLLTIGDEGAVRRTTVGGAAAAAPHGTVASGASDASEATFRDRGARVVGRTPVVAVTGGPVDLSPVGWVGNDAAVMAADPEDARPTQLLPVGPQVEARAIGRVDGSPQGLSLATDLMTSIAPPSSGRSRTGPGRRPAGSSPGSGSRCSSEWGGSWSWTGAGAPWADRCAACRPQPSTPSATTGSPPTLASRPTGPGRAEMM